MKKQSAKVRQIKKGETVIMDWQVVTAIIGLAIAILGHAFATVWWAAKVTFSLQGIQREMSEIKSELKEEGAKKDIQIQALWKRNDEMKDRILVLEQHHGG